MVGDSVGKNYNVANSRVEKFLKAYMTERVQLINGTTRDALQKALASDDPHGGVRRVFEDARERRAKMIATTEVVRGSNFAAIDAGKWVGELSKKRWSSQLDPVVRHDHDEMEGQTVDWNERFTAPNGSQAHWPGGFKEPELSVNCRCAALPSRENQRRDLGEFGDPVDLYENVRRPFVRQLEAAWRRVFDEQEAAVLAELS